tara:strand:+ start:21055 stop:22182 length:1128 start_codon:yes stop_codon:yes gene_type:complete
MFTDYVLNGQGHGEVGETFAQTRFEKGLLRPFFARNKAGREVAVVEIGRGENKELVPVSELSKKGMESPVANATSLRKDEWKMFDTVAIGAARQRLRAWSDLAAANTFGGFDGMAKSILEHETMSDPGEAFVDMDGLTDGSNDEPKFQLQGLPLPITHSDFSIGARKLAMSRNTGTPLDTTMAEAAGRRVAEQIEKTLIGAVTGLTYGVTADYGRAPTVWGYTNFPARLTDTTGTDPTGTNGPTVLTDWLGYRDALYANNFYGPFMAYVSDGWDQHLDNLFSTTEPSAGTLRSRLLEIDGINGIKRLDFLTTDFQVIFVQMTSDVARAVTGMPITTVQWDSKGGLRKNFKVMTIMVPQLRADFSDNCGILHATSS